MKNFFKKYVQRFTRLWTDDQGLVIPHKQLNWVISGLLFFGVTSFVSGYFWGQKKAVEYFIKRIEEDSFADRISYALYTMNDRDSLEFEEAENSDNEAIDSNQSSDSDDDTTGESSDNGNDNSDDTQEGGDAEEDVPLLTQENLKNNAPTVEAVVIPVEITTVEVPVIAPEKTVYLARLAGFGTLQAAQVFRDRVKVLDKGAQVVEHVSKTSKGRKMKWYQVVTSKFENKKDLTQLVERIKRKEHIGDVQIIDQKKGS